MSNFNENDNIIDVDELIDTQINGEPLYYSPTQVADILGVNYSKVIYYSKYFSDLLDIELSNRNRRYKKSDIEKLKFLLELAQDGLTLKQIKEYCAEKVPENITKDVAISNNPLQIQVLVKAMSEELDILIENKLSRYLRENKDIMEESVGFMQEQVALTMEKKIEELDKIVNDKLKNEIIKEMQDVVTKSNQEVKSYLDKKELDFKSHDEKIIDILRTGMRDAELKNENESKKGFWSRIFNKNK